MQELHDFMIFLFFTGEHVAQFKFTVLLMPNGPHRITGLPFEEELFSSEHSVKDADIQVRLLFCIDTQQNYRKEKVAKSTMVFLASSSKKKSMKSLSI